MADIYNRNTSNLAGVFTADRAKLILAGNLGVLVQRLNFSYSQTVTRLYEVGNQGNNGGGNIYYVGGRTQGQLALDRVVGPTSTIIALYNRYGDVCRARDNPITLTLTETDCSQGGRAVTERYTMKNCVITQVSIGVSAQDMIISENTTMIFASLEASL